MTLVRLSGVDGNEKAPTVHGVPKVKPECVRSLDIEKTTGSDVHVGAPGQRISGVSLGRDGTVRGSTDGLLSKSRCKKGSSG